MKPNRFTAALRRLYVAFATLLIVAAIFCYYLFVYVASIEKQVHERNFRVLQRMEKNMLNRIMDKRQLVLTNLKKMGADASFKTFLAAKSQQDAATLNALVENYRKDRALPYELDSVVKDAQLRTDWQVDNSNHELVFLVKVRDVFTGLERSGLRDHAFRVRLPLKLVVKEILRTDIFESFLLLQEDEVIFSTCNEISSVKSDSLLTRAAARSNSFRPMQIGGHDYFVFAHPFTAGGHNFTLAGMEPDSVYTSEKYTVPGNFLLTVILLLFLTVLAFPFLKSMLMSPEETLDTGDILGSLVSLLMLSFIYGFLQVHVYASFHDQHDRDAMLRKTNSEVSASFVAELDSVYAQLKEYDMVPDPRKSQNFYAHYKRVFWLNGKGRQVQECPRDPAWFDSTDYSDRRYFTAIRDQDWWPGDTSKINFYIEPITSWTDGSLLAVMSKTSHRPDASVAAISARMPSVINTILPEEMGYCIIDVHGEVLFHSVASRSLNENLLEECNVNKVLQSSIRSRADGFFEEHYMKKDCRFYISAVPDLPVYIVTFSDRSLINDIHLQMFIFTFVFITGLILLNTLVMLVYTVFRKRKKFVKRPVLDVEWLYPKQRHVENDLCVILLNLLLASVSAVLCHFMHRYPLTLLTIFTVNAVVSIALFCHARASRKSFGLLYRALIPFLALIDLLLWQTGERSAGLFVALAYEVLVLLVVHNLREGSLFRNGRLQRWKRWKFFGWQPRFRLYQQYSLMLVSWMLVVVIIPSLCIYTHIYREKHQLLLKYMQFDMAEQLYRKAATSALEKTGSFSVLMPEHGTGYTNVYVSPYYNTTLSLSSKDTLPGAHTLNAEQEAFSALVGNISFATTQFQPGMTNVIMAFDNDPAVRYSVNDSGGLVSLRYRNLRYWYPAGALAANTCTIQSELPVMPVPPLIAKHTLNTFWVIYFLAPLVFLVLLYLFIVFFLRRFFIVDFFPESSASEEGRFIAYFRGKYQVGKSRIMLLGVPSSGKHEMMEKVVQEVMTEAGEDRSGYTHAYREFDLTLLYKKADDAQDTLDDLSRVKVIVLKHFEYNLAAASSGEDDQKFALIRKIMQANVPHIIIATAIHPSVFLSSLKKDEATFNAEDYIGLKSYYNWSGLLSGFELYTRSVAVQPAETIADQSLQGEVRMHEQDEENETIIYGRYQLSYLYFQALWNSLDRLEKFVLYDLAKDNLANCRNRQGLLSLRNKGLIVTNDIPRITDESFRHFIQAEVKDTEIETERGGGEDTSAWSKFRLPFMLIIMVVLFFLFITQQETFSKLLGILAAFTAGVPTIVKVFQSVQSGKGS